MCSSFEEAVADVSDGSSLMAFHWGMGRGTPQNLIRALYEKGAKNLTLIGHNFVSAHLGDRVFSFTEVCTPLILAERAKKVITPWASDRTHGKITTLEDRIAAGEVTLELTCHGTMVERIRCGGSGLGGFYTPVGVGTILEKGKEKKVFHGREYILEEPLRADFGFVRAYKADKMGNLTYRGSIRGCNPIIAMACDIVIAEVDEIVEPGDLDPETIITPYVFVDRMVKIPEGSFGSRQHMEHLLHETLEAWRKDHSKA